MYFLWNEWHVGCVVITGVRLSALIKFKKNKIDMNIICYGSSSKGNGYILQGQKQTLLIEAGLPTSNLRKHIKDFSAIQGCLISHKHGDHAKYMGDIMKMGIPIYTNQDTWENCNASTKIGGYIEPLEQIEIGEFSVIPMYANHDVPCFSFLINHEEMGNLLFITDSAGFNYTFDDVNHVMIECNWSEECLQEALIEGRTNEYVARRSRETHMGLDVMLDYLKSEDLAKNTNEVILLHLSHENSDENQFIKIVSENLNKKVYVAKNGLNLNINLN